MALAADKDGFLIGVPIDSGALSKAATLWNGMRDDISAIREAVESWNKLTGRAIRAKSVSERKATSTPVRVEVVATPRGSSSSPRALPQRDSKGRFMAAAGVAVAEPMAKRSAPPAKNAGVRDAKGRFVGGGSKPPGASPEKTPVPGDSEGSGRSGFWSRLTGSVASATKTGIEQSAAGSENIDPAIAAAKEAGNIVAPVLKPIGTLLGGVFGRNSERKKRKEAAKENAKEQHKQDLPWYKKLLKERPVATAAGGGIGIFTALMPMLGGLLAGAIPLLLAGAGILAAGAIGGLIANKVGGWINEKFGTQIGDFIWDTSEFIKEKWTSVTSTWDSVAVKAGEWVDNASAFWSGVKETPGKVRDSISGGFDSFKGVFGFGSEGRKQTFEEGMTAAGITNANERNMMLAQAHHETGGFRNMEESFKYSPDNLRRTSKRAAGLSSGQMANLMRSGEAGIANFMYEGRNGNTEKGDGYKYRGRGYVQLTGKSNYAEAGKALGLDLVGSPDLAANPQIAAKIATWWYSSRGLNKAARAGDIGAVTRGINGGTNGLAERSSLYKKYGGAAGASASTSSATGIGVYAAPSASMTTRSSSFGAATPSVEKYTPGKPPPLLTSLGSGSRGAQTIQATVSIPVNQNVGDRQIAQVATGGIGGTGQ